MVFWIVGTGMAMEMVMALESVLEMAMAAIFCL